MGIFLGVLLLGIGSNVLIAGAKSLAISYEWSEEIIGLTIGNDMSSRSIEGENPLYLTQAKIYDKSCSIGPCMIDVESVTNLNNYEIKCIITRNDSKIFKGNSLISCMNKSIENKAYN